MTVLQFCMVLLKFGEVIMERERSGRLLDSQTFVCNFVGSHANPLCIYSYILANQEPTEESCQGTTNDQLPACMKCPILGAGVVSYAEHYRMRVNGDLSFEQGSDCCTIIDNYCHILEAIYEDECLVFIVGEVI
jgi:hypothetical protein